LGISVTDPTTRHTNLSHLISTRSKPWETLVRLLHNAELLNGEIFTTLREAQVLIENWRRHYNAVRPHSSLSYRPPAPEAILPPASGLPYAPLRPAQTLADSGRVLT
jgi:transposase InsO family protein